MKQRFAGVIVVAAAVISLTVWAATSSTHTSPRRPDSAEPRSNRSSLAMSGTATTAAQFSARTTPPPCLVSGCGHENCGGVGPDVGPTVEDAEQAAEALAGLLNRYGRSPRDAADLDALHEELARSLHAGAVSPAELANILATTDDAVLLGLLSGSLMAFSPTADNPAVFETALTLARDERHVERRRTALRMLGQMTDMDGRAWTRLADAARTAADPTTRMTAIAALNENLIRSEQPGPGEDPERRELTEPVLLDLATHGDDAGVRAQAIHALDVYGASPHTVRALSEVLHTEDAAIEVRFAVADALGDTAPGMQSEILGQLESAYSKQSDGGVRRAIMAAMVRAGRQQAIPLLDRLVESDRELEMHLDDYRSILAAGEFDLARIEAAKSHRENARLSAKSR